MHQRLINYLAGTCTEQELEQVLAYLKTKKGQRHLAAMLDEDIHRLTPSSTSQVTTDYDSLFRKIKKATTPGQRATPARRVARHSRWAIAASVTGLLLLAAAGWLILNPRPTTYQTAYGETQSIVLPDGSAVTLNANSSLTVADDFREQREVWLQGEAFFEVEKVRDPDQAAYTKFIVHTNRLQVEVLGTTFNVQDWAKKTRVVLESGKVQLTSATNQQLALEPGELAEVSEADQTIQKKRVNPGLYSAWTQNRLLCDETPLQEVALVIEHRYGKRVVFEDTGLRNRLVTGSIPIHDLSLLTEVLQESLAITIQTYEDRLIIRP